MKKKICFLIGNINNAGGTERVCSIIANQLDDLGHQVIITSISEGDKPFFELNKNIKINSLFTTSGRALNRTLPIIYRLRKTLKSEDIDTLIVVESMSVLFTLPAVQGLSTKHICWEHFNFKTDLGKFGRRLARQLAARYCDSVVTLTERDKKYWETSTSHKNQVISIPNPSPFVVQKYSPEKNSKTVLAVGRLTHQKGFDLLLQAWKEIDSQFQNWRLLIVGEGEDRNLLEEYVLQNELRNSVSFVGKTDNIGEYYKQADIFCLSSRFEGFPMVLLETLAYGIPVVAFDCDTGPAEILEGTGSILVPKEDTKQFACSLIQLIKNKALREEISSKSIEKSIEYMPDKIIKEWQKLI